MATVLNFRKRVLHGFSKLLFIRCYGGGNGAFPILLLSEVLGTFSTTEVFGAFPVLLLPLLPCKNILNVLEAFPVWFNAFDSILCLSLRLEPIVIGLFIRCTWGYRRVQFSSCIGADLDLLPARFCGGPFEVLLFSSFSYIGVCSERTYRWKVAPNVVLTKPKVAPETLRTSRPRRTMTTTPATNFTKRKQAKKFPIHWIMYPNSLKVSLILSTKKEGVNKWSNKSLSFRFKRRSRIENSNWVPSGQNSPSELLQYCIKSRIVDYIIPETFHLIGVYIPERLVSKFGNWVICPSSVGLHNKGLLKGIGSGKSSTRYISPQASSQICINNQSQWVIIINTVLHFSPITPSDN